MLMRAAEDDYSRVGVAGHMLRTEFGATPAGFLAGLALLNAAIEADTASYGEPDYVPLVRVPTAPAASTSSRPPPGGPARAAEARSGCRACGARCDAHLSRRRRRSLLRACLSRPRRLCHVLTLRHGPGLKDHP